MNRLSGFRLWWRKLVRPWSRVTRLAVRRHDSGRVYVYVQLTDDIGWRELEAISPLDSRLTVYDWTEIERQRPDFGLMA